MNKEQKSEIIKTLKAKFEQSSSFYITDTETLSVEDINTIRRECFKNQIEMKVAKNTLIKKALEQIDADKYKDIINSLHYVTALLFTADPKSPATLLKNFRAKKNGKKPALKAAYINGEIYLGDDSLIPLTKIKTKNELLGEVIGLLQSPAKRVLAGLLHHHEKTNETINETINETTN
ncbi:MAG: 50S ribosomal protein L10 [Alphaproteobacteria bacterium]|nr:50S ribosomal protein L10 [Alphaproteobacteria bacterium]